MAGVNYITPRGYARLERELDELEHVERPKIVEIVAWAASLGDRSENADYIFGKKRLRQIDRRRRWLAKRLEAAQVVDPSEDRGDRVYFGATVTVGYPDGRERTVQLVGEDEIDPARGEISWRSPLGRALMRREQGDLVTLRHAGEVTELEVVEVDYLPQAGDEAPEATKLGDTR